MRATRNLARLAVVAALLPSAVAAQAVVPPRAGYESIATSLERVIEREMADKRLPALSIALVDDQSVVWARGFGFARPRDSVRATAETVYRVGSISKLFTDLGLMRLVERGTVDLDAPVSRYLPDFRPRGRSERQISLRHLMAHRAGLVREPPLGNYFAEESASLAATVGSLNGTALVYQPGVRTKYSNAGVAAVGLALERAGGAPFARLLDRELLAPLGMHRSAFEPRADLESARAVGQMWTIDGRVFDAPTFELGMAPAGSMYSTVLDLARFASALFNARVDSGALRLRGRTLEQMWTPQFADSGRRAGFGLGFAVSELEGRRRVGHGGAIYGFASELQLLPDDGLAVAVATTADAANAVTARIAEAALRQMLAARRGHPPPPIPVSNAVPAERVRQLVGYYAKGDSAVELLDRAGGLVLRGVDGEMAAVRARGDTLVVDDRVRYGRMMVPIGDAVVVGRDTFVRARVAKPAPPPARWLGLIGEYGWDHNVLYIHERNGSLYALIEWFFPYPLRELSRDLYAFPARGLYDGERVRFTRDSGGRATQVEVGGVVFKRRTVGPEGAGQLRITPVRPVAELRAEALAARPPSEARALRTPELVELTRLDSTIKLDVRYATTNNFLGAVFYPEARAFLQRPAAEALMRAHRSVKAMGYGLLVHDAYRPWHITKMFWDATPAEKKIFVADPAQGSKHNRGAAVDVTLYELATGRPVEMVGTYDETTDRSYPDYPGGTSLQRWHRDLLRRVLEAEGFAVYEAEWWHFDYKDWREYPVMNVTFDVIAR